MLPTTTTKCCLQTKNSFSSNNQTTPSAGLHVHTHTDNSNLSGSHRGEINWGYITRTGVGQSKIWSRAMSNLKWQGRLEPAARTLNHAAPCCLKQTNTRCRWIGTDTQRGVLTGLSRKRNLRSKIWWFTEFCNSHYVSHFAAFFIVTRTKISVAKNCSRFVNLGFFSLLPPGGGNPKKKIVCG